MSCGLPSMRPSARPHASPPPSFKGGATRRRIAEAVMATCAAVRPLRVRAWTSTVRSPVGFRAMYTASSVGSFLDTVLPGRLGEASKVAVLRAASAEKWPGLPKAGGSLVAAHLTEAIAFCLVGATAGSFLPLPQWARGALVGAVV